MKNEYYPLYSLCGANPKSGLIGLDFLFWVLYITHI